MNMNGSTADVLNSIAIDVEADHMQTLFLEKEELIVKHAHEMDQFTNHNSTLDRTLWILRTEMLHLMRCDIQLWKKLRELNTSLVILKGELLQENKYRARSDTLSSASSGTDSFVSANEYNDVNFTETAENRVLLWINKSDFSGKVTEENIPVLEAGGYRPRSRTCGDPGSDRNRKWIFQDVLHDLRINDYLMNKLNNSGIIRSLTNQVHTHLDSANHLQGVFNSYSLDPFLINLHKANKMKCTEETEIVSRGDFTYYKSSLRVLGSVRMQSRIFEPSLTKWRPFALSQSPDSYIIVPPKTFSSIQPRPKLHRLANILGSGTVYLHTKAIDVEDNSKLDEKENRENLIEVGKSEASLATEHIGNEPSVPSVESDSREFNGTKSDGFKHDTRRVSEIDTDLFSTDFLEMRDGLITCRIMIPDIEQELKHTMFQQDEFEYLTIVDGRVTFTPHTTDSDDEEPYFLGWLFESKEPENIDESFYINQLFEETDGEDNDETKDNFNFISCLVKGIQLESGTAKEEMLDLSTTCQVIQDTVPNNKCTHSCSTSQLVNEEVSK